MAFPEPFHAWRPHPWHGLAVGPEPPAIVHAYIEITPFDDVKYEIDKVTGYLRVDRPQRTSSQPPTLYGFIPRTYCGPKVGVLTPAATVGDGDPLDICVFSERPINHPEVLLKAKVVGGLQMTDKGEADDKIVAVLANDFVYGAIDEIADLPAVLVERLQHYFSTYKLVPGATPARVGQVYGRAAACRVIEAAMQDYRDLYGAPS